METKFRLSHIEAIIDSIQLASGKGVSTDQWKVVCELSGVDPDHPNAQQMVLQRTLDQVSSVLCTLGWGCRDLDRLGRESDVNSAIEGLTLESFKPMKTKKKRGFGRYSDRDNE